MSDQGNQPTMASGVHRVLDIVVPFSLLILLLPRHGDPEPFLGVDEVWSIYAKNVKAKLVYNVLLSPRWLNTSASAKRLSALRSAAAASVVPGGMYSFILNGPVVGSFSAIQAL